VAIQSGLLSTSLGPGKTRLYFHREFARQPPAIGPVSVECHPPRHPDQPCPEPSPIAQLPETSISLGERLLRDVLGVFPLPEHAECDAEREPGGIRQTRLELTLEFAVGRHEAAHKAFGVLMHQASPTQDARTGEVVH